VHNAHIALNERVVGGAVAGKSAAGAGLQIQDSGFQTKAKSKSQVGDADSGFQKKATSKSEGGIRGKGLGTASQHHNCAVRGRRVVRPFPKTRIRARGSIAAITEAVPGLPPEAWPLPARDRHSN
jgi:hypothetical protein